MVRNPLTGEWSFLPVELWQSKDHQAHVSRWQRHKLEQAVFGRPEVKARGQPPCPPYPAFRYPSVTEDPAAYTYGFD